MAHHSLTEDQRFPHAAQRPELRPYKDLIIHGRWASLYRDGGADESTRYTFIWNDETEAVADGATTLEILDLLADLLCEGQSRALVILSKGTQFASCDQDVYLVVLDRRRGEPVRIPETHASLTPRNMTDWIDGSPRPEDRLKYAITTALCRLDNSLIAQYAETSPTTRDVVTRLTRLRLKCHWHNEGPTWQATIHHLEDNRATGETLTTDVRSDETNAQLIARAIFAAIQLYRQAHQ